ncbi:MAG: DUF494 family protein [Legionella sp.]
MKDSLFEILLNLFEKTLVQLKEMHVFNSEHSLENNKIDDPLGAFEKPECHTEFLKSADERSVRIFSYTEQIKLTKASYQFLMRLSTLGIIATTTLEAVINQLMCSESRIVSLQETKWTIRNVLADSLNSEQIAFIDLLLYPKEEQFSVH